MRWAGLGPLKSVLRALPPAIFMERLRRGLKAPTVERAACHCVFMGRPGVGKTRFARFFGQALHRLGAVASERFVEVQRRDLVADKVGQTGKKTRERIEEAKGGVRGPSCMYYGTRIEQGRCLWPQS